MLHGICHLAVLPVRLNPSDKEEMVNQLLFGDELTVMEEKSNWLKIKSDYNNHYGWIDNKGVMEISGKTWLSIRQNKNICIAEKMLTITRYDGTKMIVLPGSSLPLLKSDNLIMEIENKKFLIDEPPEFIFKKASSQNITNAARIFINAPYLLGGRSLFGIDCDGFIQVVYKMSRIKLQRYAWQQALEGENVASLDFALPGDLAFFKNEEEKIIHVGIILENNRIIHASGRVRVDRIDEKGIINTETGLYTHNLSIIKRFINH